MIWANYILPLDSQKKYHKTVFGANLGYRVVMNIYYVTACVSVWFSFVFANDHYRRICKKCHVSGLQIATKLTVNIVKRKFNIDKQHKVPLHQFHS